MEQEKLYSPLNFHLRDEEAAREGQYDEIHYWRDELTHEEAFEYLDTIKAFLADDRERYDNGRGLMEYYGQGPLDAKVQSLVPHVELHGDALWTVAHVRLNEPLTPMEMADLKFWWGGQLSDGWGEGLEQREIKVGRGDLYLEPWTPTNSFFIATQAEFDRRGIERPAPPVEAVRQTPVIGAPRREAESTPDLEARKEELFSRLDGNLSDYFGSIQNVSKEAMMVMSDEITTRSAVVEYLKHSHPFRPDELDLLLRYDNPLEVVAQHTPPTTTLLEMSGAISELANMEGTLDREYTYTEAHRTALADAGARDDALTEIAKKHCHVETLETRKRDSLDFHDVSVWGLKAALQEAFDAGAAHQMAKEANLELPEPDAPAVDIEALRETLTARMSGNYADMMYNLRLDITESGLSDRDLTDLAERITTVKAVHEYFTEMASLDQAQLEHLLQFQNPLEVMADRWPSAADGLLDMRDVVWDVRDMQDALRSGAYPLAGEPAAPEPPQQPATGKPSLLAELREAKARSEQQNTTPPTNKSEPER